jgi:hypothetical protein
MSRSPDKTIEAIVEIGSFEDAAPWPIAEGRFFYVRLFSGTSDAEIGSLMMAAFSPVTEEIIRENAAETLRAFVANDDGFVLSGGLFFKENGEIKVGPGCCGGLEDWDRWFDVAEGKTDIWTGHDPSVLVEVKDRTIKIWNDQAARDEKFSLEFTREELIRRLEIVEKDLRDFLERLRQWTAAVAPGLEERVVRHFAKNMSIKI